MGAEGIASDPMGVGRGMGKAVTCIAHVESAGVIACACGDGSVYLRETRIGGARYAC